MAYSTVADVKVWLPEISGTTQYDSEITAIIADVDSRIDEALRPYTSVPLTSTPTEIRKISAEWSAGIFRLRRASPGERNVLVEDAEERLQRFIESNYTDRYAQATGGLDS